LVWSETLILGWFGPGLVAATVIYIWGGAQLTLDGLDVALAGRTALLFLLP